MITKRKYAHELYPHPSECEIRDLAVDVPYLYARAIGLEVRDTGWFDADPVIANGRMNHLITAREVALLADALHQNLTGQEGWRWAQERSNEESGEFIWERAAHYGIDADAIKPYPCGPEPASHYHQGLEWGTGWRLQTRINGPESECGDCCEPEDFDAEAES